MKELAKHQEAGKENKVVFFPCSWFYAAVQRAGQARLPLIHSKWWVSHLGKEALEATMLFFPSHKTDKADISWKGLDKQFELVLLSEPQIQRPLAVCNTLREITNFININIRIEIDI